MGVGGVERPALNAGQRPLAEPAVYGSALDKDYVLYDPRGGQGYVLNATGARVWALCNGAHTLETIAQEIASVYQIDPERALADVGELIDDLQAAGLLASA